MVEYIKSKACVQFLLGGKRTTEHVHVRNYTTNGQIIAAKDCPIFLIIFPVSGTVFPTNYYLMGSSQTA